MSARHMKFLDEVATAIETASCKGCEGPFGSFDYSSYGATKPYVVRDFRPNAAPGEYGRTIGAFDTPEPASKLYNELTRRYIAQCAAEAVFDHIRRGSPGSTFNYLNDSLLPCLPAPTDK